MPLIVIWGFSIIVCALPGPEQSFPHNLKDGGAYAALVGATLGLAAAWRWELAGGALAFGAGLVGAALAWRADAGLGANCLFVANGALFVIAGWLGREARLRG